MDDHGYSIDFRVKDNDGNVNSDNISFLGDAYKHPS